MKILTDFYNYTPSGNAASGYALTNLKSIDTNEIWKGTANSETIRIDLGSAKSVDTVFLNNSNFTSASVTVTNSSDYSGGTTKNFTLVKDDLGIYRAFCDIGGGNTYRYIKIICSTLVSGSVCQLGNVIIGKSSEIVISEWSADVIDLVASFESDGGAYREKKKGQSRHSFNASFTSTKDGIDSLPLNFSQAVIYTDLNDIADAYIIGIPQSRRKSVRNPVDCSLSVVFKELI